MFYQSPEPSETLNGLSKVNQELADLMPRFATANEAFAQAARPLDKLSELNSGQRRELVARIRAAEQECEQVTQLINQALAEVASLGKHSRHSPAEQKDTSPIQLVVADGLSVFVHRWLPPELPKAVVQIAHGVAEHGGRYARLAGALNAAGYAVYANDHRGHGRTARTSQELGFFAENGGWQKCLRDLWDLNRRIATDHPGLPIVLLGHSMGSFMAQQFISEHGDVLHGAVLCGTSGEAPRGVAVARLFASFERWRVGAQGKSGLLAALTFGSFNKPFEPARTPFDWLSRDNAEVDKYALDPLCGGFRASVQLFIDVLNGIQGSVRPERRARIPRSLPILVIAGTRDPVGRNGAGVDCLLTNFVNAGLERVTDRLYPDARHELFNETNRHEVTSDLIAWVDEAIH
jgi:alpha-beta hydrolase superfamily lysophospholipase